MRSIRKHPLHLPLEVGPLDRPVEIVEGHRAAAQQELAQARDLGVGRNPGARLDEIDPRIGPQRLVIQIYDHGIVDLDGGDGSDATREVLLGGWIVDGPALVVGIAAGEPGQLRAVIPDPREGPLQARESRIGPRAILRARLERRDAAQQDDRRARDAQRGPAARLPSGSPGPFLFTRLSAVDGLQQDFLRTLEARSDLERRQRFALRIGRAIGQQVAFGEIAVRRGPIRGADRQRDLELAQRDGGVLGAQRQAAEAGVAGHVEGIELDEPGLGERKQLLVVGLRGQLDQPPRRVDRSAIASQQRAYSVIARSGSLSCSASPPMIA